MKKRKVIVQVLYGASVCSLGIDSDEQADMQLAVRDNLTLSFLPSVLLERRHWESAFENAIILIFVGALSFYFLRALAQRLGDEAGKGIAWALKMLAQKLWEGRQRKTYSQRSDLAYVFTYKSVDCAIHIRISFGQTEESVSKGLNRIFKQMPQQLKLLMDFIDQNLDHARAAKDDYMPVAYTNIGQEEEKKGKTQWIIHTESKRELFYKTF